MKHGFITLASAVPDIALAAPSRNLTEHIQLVKQAAERGVQVLCFPALSLTGSTCGDLVYTDLVLDNARQTLLRYARETAEYSVLTFVGLPLLVNGRVYTCSAAVCGGTILGIVPKQGEISSPLPTSVEIGGQTCPFGANLRFTCTEQPALSVGCVIGSDFESPNSPLPALTSSGATVVVCPGEGMELVGKEAYRRVLAEAESGKYTCALVYTGAGESESSTDGICSGHCLIAAGGGICGENAPFAGEKLVSAVVDLYHLRRDRMQTPGWGNTAGAEMPFSLPLSETDITGCIPAHPFVPADPGERRAVCSRILEMQARGLAKRIRAAHAAGAVVALSGGLDSTLALLVTAKAMDLLGHPRREILSVTMPCFGTTVRTRGNAEELALCLGTDFRCIDIKEAVDLHFRDIGHDAEDHSVVYENAQARERTQIIMDIANRDGSLVIGTGDLSELALGWATYNGDHMSNYGVNGGVPKTLIRGITAYCADLAAEEGNTALAKVLRDILDTPVSPELLPPKDGDIAQRTEDIVGPYDLHDFFLYHLVRWGESPDKIFREAKAAFAGTFPAETIEKWLRIFLRRFYNQQFKRSALPDGPRVGTVGLSPRGAWHMPSDAVPDDFQL